MVAAVVANFKQFLIPRLPAFVMGAAAGLIRLRCHEETNLSPPIPSPGHNPPGLLLTFLDLSEICWKTRVDLCSLLLVLVPVLAQVLPSLPFLPSLGLAANVLFVLPQLVVITGDLFPTKNIGLSKKWLIILTTMMTKAKTENLTLTPQNQTGPSRAIKGQDPNDIVVDLHLVLQFCINRKKCRCFLYYWLIKYFPTGLTSDGGASFTSLVCR